MLVLYKEGKRWHIRAQKVANEPTCSLLYGSIQPQKSWRSTSAVFRESLVNPQCHLFLWLKLVNGGCISFGQQQMLQLTISPTCPDWRPVGWLRLFGLLQAIHQPSVATGGFKRCWQPASPRPRLRHVLKQTGHVTTCKFSPGRNSPKIVHLTLVGYDIAGLFSFDTPTWVPETVPRLSLLKSDVTGNFIEFLL